MTDQPPPTMDEMLARHEASGATEEDIHDVAKLFNQVGSSLSSLDQMNVDGSKPAMKLDKNAVLALQSGSQNPAPAPHPQPPPVPPVAPVSPSSPTPPGLTQPAVTVDHKTYDSHLKKMNTISRKLSKIEKELTNLKTIHNADIKPGKYKVVSGDDVEITSTDPTLLLSVISSQLDNKAREITIIKC